MCRCVHIESAVSASVRMYEGACVHVRVKVMPCRYMISCDLSWYVNANVYVCTYTCADVWYVTTKVGAYVSMSTYTHIFTRVCVNVRANLHKSLCTHAFLLTYIHARAHIYTH